MAVSYVQKGGEKFTTSPPTSPPLLLTDLNSYLKSVLLLFESYFNSNSYLNCVTGIERGVRKGRLLSRWPMRTVRLKCTVNSFLESGTHSRSWVDLGKTTRVSNQCPPHFGHYRSNHSVIRCHRNRSALLILFPFAKEKKKIWHDLTGQEFSSIFPVNDDISALVPNTVKPM